MIPTLTTSWRQTSTLPLSKGGWTNRRAEFEYDPEIPPEQELEATLYATLAKLDALRADARMNAGESAETPDRSCETLDSTSHR